jgi:hypothetical protein
MNYFENEYAKFLSINLILNNVNIHRSYFDFLKEFYPLAYNDLEKNQDFSKVYEPKQYDDIDYNQEIIDTMVCLMNYTRNNYTTLNKKDIFFDLLKSDREKMFHYIWNILNIERHSYANHEEDELLDYLSQFQLHDGVLIKLEYKQDTCNLYISGILHYTYDDVTRKDIIMKFKQVDNITIKGSLYLNDLSYSCVYDINSYKTSKDCYCYDILCINQDEPLIITITFNNVKVIEMNDESLNLFNH